MCVCATVAMAMEMNSKQTRWVSRCCDQEAGSWAQYTALTQRLLLACCLVNLDGLRVLVCVRVCGLLFFSAEVQGKNLVTLSHSCLIRG